MGNINLDDETNTTSPSASLRPAYCPEGMRMTRFLVISVFSFYLLSRIPPVCAQDQAVLFSTSDPGVQTAISNWGVNTLSTTDIQRDLIFMGSNTVNFVLVAFQAETPQTNNSLISSDITVVTNNIIAAAMVPTTNWVMSFGSGAGVNSWYQSGSGTVYPNLWATNMEVW